MHKANRKISLRCARHLLPTYWKTPLEKYISPFAKREKKSRIQSASHILKKQKFLPSWISKRTELHFWNEFHGVRPSKHIYFIIPWRLYNVYNQASLIEHTVQIMSCQSCQLGNFDRTHCTYIFWLWFKFKTEAFSSK